MLKILTCMGWDRKPENFCVDKEDYGVPPPSPSDIKVFFANVTE